MPILIDASQLMYSNLFADNTIKPNDVSPDLFRHFMLNSIRSIRNKWSAEFGEPILCFDGPNNWRKKAWPLYKAGRAESREKSEWDFELIFKIFGDLYHEFTEVLPYRCLKVDGCEGDDLIFALAMYFNQEELVPDPNDPFDSQLVAQKVLIISSDKDFKCLQRYPNVQQWSSIQKKWVDEMEPERFLQQLIIKGDPGDGIPNIKSPEDSFVTKTRQKPIRSDVLEKWITDSLEMGSAAFDDPAIRARYELNTTLISPFFIPQGIRNDIISAYKNTRINSRSGLLNYFIKHRLTLLTQYITEF